jgi:large subunit ribosomal protein L3
MVFRCHIDQLVRPDSIKYVSIPLSNVFTDCIPQDPGRVWPGKKMAGRLGGERITVQNLPVVRVDTALDLIFVKGAVPGVDDAHVLIRDAKKKMLCLANANQAKGLYEDVLPKGVDDLPFPAGTKEMVQSLPPVIEAPSKRSSPFIPRE